jgi:hypothetical protein
MQVCPQFLLQIKMRMKNFVEEPNLLGLGLSRRWEGAVIGIFIVLLLSLLGRGADFPWLTAAFLFPGYLVAFIVGSPTSHLLGVLILFGISSIPAAIIGSLIVSKNDTKNIWYYLVDIVRCIIDIFLCILLHHG